MKDDQKDPDIKDELESENFDKPLSGNPEDPLDNEDTLETFKKKIDDGDQDPDDEESEDDLDNDTQSKASFQTEPVSSEHTLDDLAKEDLPDPEPKNPYLNQNAQQDGGDDMHIPNLRSHGSVNTGYSRYDQGGYSNQFSSNKPNRSSKWHIIVLLIIGVVVIGGTVFLLKKQLKQTPSTNSVEINQAPTPTPIPTPIPTPSFDRAKFKVRVLNGTPKTGLAASVSAKLKGLGYQPERVGNATNSAFARTILKVKASAPGLFEQLMKDLSPDFDASSAGSLKDSDAADGEVILGTK